MHGSRLFLSYFGNKFIKFALSIDCNEFTSSYRGFNLKKLKDFNFKNISAKGYSFFMETVVQIHNKGITINQIPIYFANRKQGKSKIPKIELFRTLFNIIKLKLKSKL